MRVVQGIPHFNLDANQRNNDAVQEEKYYHISTTANDNNDEENDDDDSIIRQSLFYVHLTICSVSCYS